MEQPPHQLKEGATAAGEHDDGGKDLERHESSGTKASSCTRASSGGRGRPARAEEQLPHQLKEGASAAGERDDGGEEFERHESSGSGDRLVDLGRLVLGQPTCLGELSGGRGRPARAETRVHPTPPVRVGRGRQPRGEDDGPEPPTSRPGAGLRTRGDALRAEEDPPEGAAPPAVGSALVALAPVALVVLSGLAEGLEHPALYVGAALLAALAAGHLAARRAGLAGPRTQAPVALLAAGLSSLAISLGSLGRRRCDACEQVPASLWIALVLGVASLALGAGPPGASRAQWRAFAVLGQGVSLQHLLVGIALPSGCSHRLLLGLPPHWATCLQLSALAALLAAGCRPSAQESTAERLVEQYMTDVTEDADADVSSETARERVTNSIESWERRCQRLLEDLEPCVSTGGAGGSSRLWAAFADHLAEVLEQCRAQLQNRPENSWDMNTRLLRAVKDQPNGSADLQFLSGWLQQVWDPTEEFSRQQSMDSIMQVPQRTLQRVAGARTELLVGEWSFDALEVESSGHTVMQLVGFELLQTYASLPHGALTAFLSTLEKAYGKENPYHSYIHAADMCNSFYFLATTSKLWEVGRVSDWVQMTSLIAALGHDVGHFGRNNMFLGSTRHALAVTYNDRSVLENFHAATLVQMLEQSYGSGSDVPENLFIWQPSERLPRIRLLIILLILSTDITKHLEDLSAFRVRLGAADYSPMSDLPGVKKGDQEQAMCMLFRSADIGHSAKDWNIHMAWTERVTREFHDQGDEEKQLGLAVSPLCDREGFVLASSQVGFLQFICVPTWKEIARFEIALHVASDGRESPWSPAPPKGLAQLSIWGSENSAITKLKRSQPDEDPSLSELTVTATSSMPMKKVTRIPSDTKLTVTATSSMPMKNVTRIPSDTRGQRTAERVAKRKKRAEGFEGQLSCVCLRLAEQNLLTWAMSSPSPK